MKPSIPQGTRDFDAGTLRKRRFILDTIKNVFEVHGFEPLETPAMENLETLMGKYGDEGDKLIYRILDSGNPLTKNFFVSFAQFLKDHDALYKTVQKTIDKDSNEKSPYEAPLWKIPPELLAALSKKLLEEEKIKKYLPTFKNELSSKALRYDLTIPFARYVAMNFGKLTMPYKRYQMQNVWRADRPQKGRYREFYQCDADIAGTTSLISDVELAEIYIAVFKKLSIEVDIKINSRKILAALAEVCGVNNISAITVAIDKLDKIGIEKVEEELMINGLNTEQVSTIKNYLAISGSNEDKIASAKSLLGNTENGVKGIEELEFILGYINNADKNADTIQVDLTLARGLNYYTGIIYEVKARNAEMGSIGGGGRYDDLTGLFGLPNVPGVGISFGVDRIFDVMEGLDVFPKEINKSTTALFLNLGERESRFAFNEMQKLREAGISSELFYEQAKLEKQFKYANKKNISFAIIIGSNEIEQKTCIVKDLVKAQQQTIPLINLVSFFN